MYDYDIKNTMKDGFYMAVKKLTSITAVLILLFAMLPGCGKTAVLNRSTAEALNVENSDVIPADSIQDISKNDRDDYYNLSVIQAITYDCVMYLTAEVQFAKYAALDYASEKLPLPEYTLYSGSFKDTSVADDSAVLSTRGGVKTLGFDREEGTITYLFQIYGGENSFSKDSSVTLAIDNFLIDGEPFSDFTADLTVSWKLKNVEQAKRCTRNDGDITVSAELTPLTICIETNAVTDGDTASIAVTTTDGVSFTPSGVRSVGGRGAATRVTLYLDSAVNTAEIASITFGEYTLEF